jgi:hypothetical protein
LRGHYDGGGRFITSRYVEPPGTRPRAAAQSPAITTRVGGGAGCCGVDDLLAVDLDPTRSQVLPDALLRQAGGQEAIKHGRNVSGLFVGNVVIVRRNTDSWAPFAPARRRDRLANDGPRGRVRAHRLPAEPARSAVRRKAPGI